MLIASRLTGEAGSETFTTLRRPSDTNRFRSAVTGRLQWARIPWFPHVIHTCAPSDAVKKIPGTREWWLARRVRCML